MILFNMMMVLMRIMARVIFIYQIFQFISDIINSNTENLRNHFVYNDEAELYLPIPVYPYIRPDMGTQFILHVLLSLG